MSTLDFQKLRDIRAAHPHAIADIYAGRQRRELIRGDGKLFIVAADHSARGALGVRNNKTAMASRYDLLERLATALAHPAVDGVLGTPDIIDDLALLGLLENKIVVGSMNRGGLQGASFEMDDRYTGYDIAGIERDRLDFAKNLVRINLSDSGSLSTLAATAAAVTAAAVARVPIMVEPFLSEWVDGKIVNDLSTDAVILSVAIAQALGTSSAYTWLKLPVVAGMDRVMEATTLPTLLLGGNPVGDPAATYRSWGDALALPGVRGLVVGRSLLYPPDGDVAAAIAIAATLVHGSN